MDYKIKNGILVKCKVTKGSVMLPEGIVSIDDEKAFRKCKKITSVTLPSSLKKFSWGTFNRCNMLKELNIKDENPFYCSENGVLYDKEKRTLIYYPLGLSTINRQYQINDSVEVIGKGAFIVTKVKKIIFSENLKVIDEFAFYYSSLENVILPKSLEEIGRSAFSFSNVSKISIPENVATIGMHAFIRCDKLKELHLLCVEPPKLDARSLGFEDIADRIGVNICSSTVPIFIPKGKISLYKNSQRWKRHISQIVEL